MKLLAARIGLAAVLSTTAALQAAELGRFTVFSRLGQPLSAEIEIRALQPGEEKSLAARLASPAAFRRAGIPFDRALADLRVFVDRRGTRPVLRLRTTRPVSEPFLHALIVLQSSAGSSTRSYTVLLDPPGYTPPASTAAAKPSAKPTEPPAAKPAPEVPPPAGKPAPPPSSREELFGVGPAEAASKAREPGSVEWRGFVQNSLAYDYKDPKHWSRAVLRTQLGAQGAASGFKWKASARVDLDPVYASGHHYPQAVRRDQRRDFFLRETYLDTSAGGLEWRIGKQNVVWGEMVGLFFADVVSARDQRDFILPEFDIIRIPQWAVRAERFGENAHAELIWLPVPEVDDIGKPGAEFFPFPETTLPGFAQRFNNPERPQRSLRHSNLGLRASTLRGGWDTSLFYYRSTDVNPTFYREVTLAPAPTLTYTPRHDRIWQAGGTLAKDFGAVVAKGELIYASGRRYSVTRLAQADGVVPQDTLDYVAGLDFSVAGDTRLNLQYFERVFLDHDADLLQDRRERGVTLLLSGRLGTQFVPELLVIQSANRRDRLTRAKLGWVPARNLRFTLGVDAFTGPPSGFFGRFDNRDRTYLETRYDF